MLEFILLVISNIRIFEWSDECLDIARDYPGSYAEHTYLHDWLLLQFNYAKRVLFGRNSIRHLRELPSFIMSNISKYIKINIK